MRASLSGLPPPTDEDSSIVLSSSFLLCRFDRRRRAAGVASNFQDVEPTGLSWARARLSRPSYRVTHPNG